MHADTASVSAYFNGPDGPDAAVDFLSDVGGDASDYGVEDPSSWTPQTLAQALRLYMQGLAEMGALDTDTAAACRSAQVDWAEVLRHAQNAVLPQ